MMTANSRASDMTMTPPMSQIRSRFHMEILNRLVWASFVKLARPVNCHLATGSVIPSILKKLMMIVRTIGYKKMMENISTAGLRNSMIIPLFRFIPVSFLSADDDPTAVQSALRACTELLSTIQQKAAALICRLSCVLSPGALPGPSPFNCRLSSEHPQSPGHRCCRR